MKILLISSNIAETPYPLYPLGCSMIAAALINAGHNVWQFDFLEQETSLDALRAKIADIAPELIGVSIRNIDNVNLMNTSYYIEIVKSLVREVKKVSNVPVILGGAGFSLIPDLILQETGADYGIVGEGESLIVELVNNMAQGIYPPQRLIGPQTRLSGNDIPSASYDGRLIDFYLGKGGTISIQTKRGCTGNCVYCTYPVLEGNKIRSRNPGSVVDDIETLANRHKVNYIFFTDSVFNDNEGAYLNVLEEMLRRKLKVSWTAFFKPQGLTDEIVEMMKRTGFTAAEIGSDAACDTTLKKLGKGFSFRDIMECNDLFVRHGVASAHFFMFGGPGETKETVFEGIENIKSLNGCVSFIFMGIRILPNTPLAALAIKEKIISPADGLLKPVYYISPAIEQDWLKETLTKAFLDVKRCVFPPDTFDNAVRVLHKLGYSGSLWDMLIPKTKQDVSVCPQTETIKGNNS